MSNDSTDPKSNAKRSIGSRQNNAYAIYKNIRQNILYTMTEFGVGIIWIVLISMSLPKKSGKKIGLFILFSFLLFQVTGQNHFVGIKSGPNWTNNTIKSRESQNKFKSGFTGGLTYEYLIDKHFSLGADLMYDQRGFNLGYTVLNYSGNPNLIDQIYKVSYRFDYVSIPIKTGFNTGKNIYSFINLGLNPSFLLDATTKTRTFNLDETFTGLETNKVFDQMQKFDLSGFFEVGGGYKIKHRYWFFTSFSYQYSITTYYFLTYQNEENRHNGVNLFFGLKYALADNSQKPPNPEHSGDKYYSGKSKNQKTLAKALLYSGLGIAALGGIVQSSNNNGWNFDFTGAWIAIAGGGVCLISVPFFISSGVNARNAAILSIRGQHIFIPQTNAFAPLPAPSASLKIKF